MPTLTADPPSVNLLDIDPELGSRLAEDDRDEARPQLVVPMTPIRAGPWVPQPHEEDGRPFSLLVAEGVLLREVALGSRLSLQVLGPGDFLPVEATGGESLDVTVTWTAAIDSCVAILDDRLQAPFALWPALATALVERAAAQLARMAVLTAIAQLPRVDQRLEATFWELADRWGRVTPAGIHIPLALTHETLARLAGGRRPTISLALTELAERGVVVRNPDRTWLLTAPAPPRA